MEYTLSNLQTIDQEKFKVKKIQKQQIIQQEQNQEIHNDVVSENLNIKDKVGSMHYCRVICPQRQIETQKLRSIHSFQKQKVKKQRKLHQDNKDKHNQVSSCQKEQLNEKNLLLIKSINNSPQKLNQIEMKRKIYQNTLLQINEKFIKSRWGKISIQLKKKKFNNSFEKSNQLTTSTIKNTSINESQKLNINNKRIQQKQQNKRQIYLYWNKKSKKLKNQRKTCEISSQHPSQEDSIQYLNNQTPGPDHYSLNKTKQTELKQRNTFGKQTRFRNCRPITAFATIHCTQIPKQKYINNLQAISFGTSKSNPRSQIKKVEYCDWNRPHFYQKQLQTLKKSQKQSSCFLSTKQRFDKNYPEYKGPDYLVSCQRIIKNNELDLPCHYFLSDVPKGPQFLNAQFDNRDFLSFQQKKQIKKNPLLKSTKKYFIRQILNDSKIEQDSQQGIQHTKNALFKRNRKPTFKKAIKSLKQKQNVKQQITNNYINQEQMDNKTQKIKHNIKNTWIIPTFNNKFKSNPVLYRI